MSAPGSSPPIPPGLCEESRIGEAIAVESVLTGLALLVVIFRFFSRMNARKGLMADDYTMFFAMVGQVMPKYCFMR